MSTNQWGMWLGDLHLGIMQSLRWKEIILCWARMCSEFHGSLPISMLIFLCASGNFCSMVAKERSGGPSKILGFILWGTWTSAANLMETWHLSVNTIIPSSLHPSVFTAELHHLPPHWQQCSGRVLSEKRLAECNWNLNEQWLRNTCLVSWSWLTHSTHHIPVCSLQMQRFIFCSLLLLISCANYMCYFSFITSFPTMTTSFFFPPSKATTLKTVCAL